jgi:general secretion pathway protein A
MTAYHREALAGLVHSACNHSGLTVLSGEAGCGKTMLLHVLKGWLEKRNFRIGFCTNPTLTRAELYDLLLFQLGITCPSSLKSRQLIALEESLYQSKRAGKRAIIIVDEAHALSRELLEEVRLLLNLETAQEKLLDIIIAGQPELIDTLRCSELRQLKQRVACFCRLDRLSLPEVTEYIKHRFAQAGVPHQEIFPEATIKLVYEYTHGIPRLVNTLCDGALRTGFALGCRQMTASIICEAAEDLDLVRSERLNDNLFNRHTDDLSEKTGDVLPDGDSYTNRQKSVGVLAALVDRWRS